MIQKKLFSSWRGDPRNNFCALHTIENPRNNYSALHTIEKWFKRNYFQVEEVTLGTTKEEREVDIEEATEEAGMALERIEKLKHT